MQARLSDFFKKDFCSLDLKASAKEGAIREMAALLSKSGKLKDSERFVSDLLGKWRHNPGCFDKKTMIAHSLSESVDGLVAGFGRSKNGINCNVPDCEKANLVFLIGANPRDLDIYLVMLAKLSRLLNEEFFRRELITADTNSEIISIIKRFEVR